MFYISSQYYKAPGGWCSIASDLKLPYKKGIPILFLVNQTFANTVDFVDRNVQFDEKCRQNIKLFI